MKRSRGSEGAFLPVRTCACSPRGVGGPPPARLAPAPLPRDRLRGRGHKGAPGSFHSSPRAAARSEKGLTQLETHSLV